MDRHPAVWMITMLVALSLLAGCGSGGTETVRQELQEANRHISASAEAIKGLSDFQRSWEELVTGGQADSAPEVRALLLEAQASEKKALSELELAEKTLRGAWGEPVSEEMKTYLEMKLDALSEQIAGLEEELLAMPIRLEVISLVEKEAPLDQVLQLHRQIEEKEARSMELLRNAGVMHQDANDYYDEKQLGS
ncbi:MAG: hypothetical protein KKF41_15345 [Actinobacteria bacterium]|nr:hypothetical protein [Actinomycetota bacterium]MBU1943618.1 hypothetical protein [Actinomycetota bacterium]MBU2688951.1 hypothetical protein [Actinomycetota bacterium]